MPPLPAAMRPFREAIWYERDGDLNPTWILVGAFTVLGIIAAVAGIYVAVVERSALLMGGVLAFIFSETLMFTLGALPVAKAKIVAQSRVLEAAAKGISMRETCGGDNDGR